jgi:hypothetical protein
MACPGGLPIAHCQLPIEQQEAERLSAVTDVAIAVSSSLFNWQWAIERQYLRAADPHAHIFSFSGGQGQSIIPASGN